MKRKIPVSSKSVTGMKRLNPARRITASEDHVKTDPTVITDAMYNQDVTPFQEGFDVLAQEMARALPQWTDKISHDNPAERAGLFLRTMRNAAGFSQTKLGELAKIRQSDISALETGSGKQGPTFDVIARIADACGFYVTFAAKKQSPQAMTVKHHGTTTGSQRVVRTYVMGEDGELSEYEGASPSLKRDGTIVLDDSAGHTYKVSVEGARAKVLIEEAEDELAAAVQQIQSAAG